MKSMCAVLIVGALVLVGCASAVSGQGHAVRPATSRDFPTVAPSTPAATVPARFRRSPASTAIGDPPTADLCSVVSDAAFTRPGWAARFAWEQYPPGCEVDMQASGSAVTVEAYATPDPPEGRAGRRTRHIAGELVYEYRFESAHGDCERAIVARGVTIMVDASTDPKGKAKPDRTVNCGSSDRMVSQIATGIAKGAVSRLAVAAPSITSLDSCEVARAARWSSVSAVGGLPLTPDAFGAGCGIDSNDVGVLIEPVIAQDDQVDGASSIRAGNHHVYAFDDNTSSDCEFVSVQSTTSEGHYEALDLQAHDAGHSAGFCAQITAAFGRYLTLAGLR